jgi:hypothetical protein
MEGARPPKYRLANVSFTITTLGVLSFSGSPCHRWSQSAWRGRSRKAKRFQLLRIYLDVLVFGILEAVNKVRLFDLACLVDVLMMHTLVRLRSIRGGVTS